ncbi:SdpI family protein [Alkalicoccobacillus murimartini]|uniref:Membrane protein n=1 Tax=Alkalicoccobacillus murimartini TaxID=171685 RepID=A0ABT9YHV8_9BACI|nr:SdpI family protein [Alkalicoccobacillus murimartini]MDQ0207457.1 putative membrane protein [Alkalicoccobacillus murimartini]
MRVIPIFLLMLAFLISGITLFNLGEQRAAADWIAVCLFPLLMITVYPVNYLLFKAYQSLTDTRFEFESLAQIVMSVFIFVIHLAISLHIIGFNVNVGLVIGILFGSFMMIVGYAFPKTKPNVLFGARTIWALKDDEVWRLTNHFAGKLTVYIGAALILCTLIFANSFALIISTLLFLLIILTIIIEIFSYKTYKKLYRE